MPTAVLGILLSNSCLTPVFIYVVTILPSHGSGAFSFPSQLFPLLDLFLNIRFSPSPLCNLRVTVEGNPLNWVDCWNFLLA